jgi:hypothetical protein
MHTSRKYATKHTYKHKICNIIYIQKMYTSRKTTFEIHTNRKSVTRNSYNWKIFNKKYIQTKNLQNKIHTSLNQKVMAYVQKHEVS